MSNHLPLWIYFWKYFYLHKYLHQDIIIFSISTMEGRKYSSAMTIFNLLFQFLFNPTLHAETPSVIKRKKTFFWKNFLNLVQSAEIDVQIRLHNKLQSYKVASPGNTTSILDPRLFLILFLLNYGSEIFLFWNQMNPLSILNLWATSIDDFDNFIVNLCLIHGHDWPTQALTRCKFKYLILATWLVQTPVTVNLTRTLKILLKR